MFQFPGFASNPYVFRTRYLHLTIRSPKPPAPLGTNALGIRIVEGGFPHSEIRGSKLVRSSPRHIAAYHVLHRLSAPRHSPNALKSLDRSHSRCSPLGPSPRISPRVGKASIGKTSNCARFVWTACGQARRHIAGQPPLRGGPDKSLLHDV